MDKIVLNIKCLYSYLFKHQKVISLFKGFSSAFVIDKNEFSDAVRNEFIRLSHEYSGSMQKLVRTKIPIKRILYNELKTNMIKTKNNKMLT